MMGLCLRWDSEVMEKISYVTKALCCPSTWAYVTRTLSLVRAALLPKSQVDKVCVPVKVGGQMVAREKKD